MHHLCGGDGNDEDDGGGVAVCQGGLWWLVRMTMMTAAAAAMVMTMPLFSCSCCAGRFDRQLYKVAQVLFKRRQQACGL